jgi:hypothetical protein
MPSFRTTTARGLTPIVLPESGAVWETAIQIDWNDAGALLNINEIVNLCELPAGVQLLDFVLITDDIDTGATPTAAATLGLLNAAGTAVSTAFRTGITVFQTGGVFRSDVSVPSLDTPNVTRRLGLQFTGATAGSLVNRRGWLIMDLRTV